MRIIGGIFKGRRFVPPANNWPTRPTTDMSKESLFNILNNRVDWEDMVMLDLFGGTGSHCYECISRGCTDATYVDNFAGCVSFVKTTAETLKIEDHIKIIKSDVFKFLQTNIRQNDYIFADPPYSLPKLATLPDLIFQHNALAADGLFVLEHDKSHQFKQHSRFIEERKYGATLMSFFG
ncbi:MAG TPA: RsmD family RNA methyltransferase [Saprospiraceae bacterium]|nr:RsmD family RNA methyltransferase [Saprospiraceae bacterium]